MDLNEELARIAKAEKEAAEQQRSNSTEAKKIADELGLADAKSHLLELLDDKMVLEIRARQAATLAQIVVHSTGSKIHGRRPSEDALQSWPAMSPLHFQRAWDEPEIRDRVKTLRGNKIEISIKSTSPVEPIVMILKYPQ